MPAMRFDSGHDDAVLHTYSSDMEGRARYAVVTRDNWRPTGINELEAEAWAALRSTSDHLVVAGPGAGKTELLAQRAAYLLQTGLAPAPRRILAISFKKDAAAVLRDRVRERVGAEARLDSYTFDAFAKGLVERFRPALPVVARPPSEYDLAVSVEHKNSVRELVRQVVRGLRATTPTRSLPRAHRGVEQDPAFVDAVLAGAGLRGGPAGAEADERRSNAPDEVGVLAWATGPAWRALLAASPCVLTFDMLKRMAQLLVEENPRIAAALRATYSHVFLDEFQDVTPLQYGLLRTCFPPTARTPRSRTGGAVLTAVGDDKQRIMGFAGAMVDGFGQFTTDYGATRRTLLMNYRSDAELVRIQRTLIAALDDTCPLPTAAPSNHAGTGRCEVLSFRSDDDEALHVAELVDDLLAGRNAPYGPVPPRQVCLLARMWPARYAGGVQRALGERGIASRLEDPYDELLRDDIVRAVLRVLRLAAGVGGREDYASTRNLVLLLGGADDEGPRGRALEEELGRKIDTLRAACAAACPSGRTVSRSVRFALNRVFGGSAQLRAPFPHARNEREFQATMRSLVDLLTESAGRCSDWGDTLADLAGEQTVPIMSTHKSKGLQFHTVVLLGLENEAWARFRDLEHEDKCLFFVGFSRAKQQVLFTYAAHRRLVPNGDAAPQGRDRVSALYDLLREAGVPLREC